MLRSQHMGQLFRNTTCTGSSPARSGKRFLKGRCPKIKKCGLGRLSKQGTDSEKTICSVIVTNLPITSIKYPRSYVPAQMVFKYQGHCLLSSSHLSSSSQSKYKTHRKKKLVKTYHGTVTKRLCCKKAVWSDTLVIQSATLFFMDIFNAHQYVQCKILF